MRREMVQHEDGELGKVYSGPCRQWISVSILRSLGSHSSVLSKTDKIVFVCCMKSPLWLQYEE